MIIAPNQKVTMSSVGRTALYVDGNYTYISEPGAYKLASLTVKDQATVNFQKPADRNSVNPVSIGTLELSYGGVVNTAIFHLVGNEVILHAGSTIQMSGGGDVAGQGKGAGNQVSVLCHLSSGWE